MKHTKDALKLVATGDGDGALSILENLLSLAPQNHEGLRLKAEILDARGRFDESLKVLHQLSQSRGLDADSIKILEERATEEKEALVFSELTSEGRWYFSFPSSQVWVSLMGFLGCAAFLILAPQLLGEGFDRFYEMTFAFCFLVILPWIGLISLHVFGVKKILVSGQGLKICRRFSHSVVPWKMISSLVVEYDKNPKTGHLKLLFNGLEKGAPPFLRLDISEKNAVVKARRHFVRNILSYVDIVIYLSKENIAKSLSKVEAATPLSLESPLSQLKNKQNTDDVA
jgi:hypothetical protein